MKAPKSERSGKNAAIAVWLVLALCLFGNSIGNAQFSPSFEEFKSRMSQQQLHQQQVNNNRQLEEQIKIENICEKPEVQKVLISFYNGNAQLTSGTGRIVSIGSPTTQLVMVSNNLLGCNGLYKFDSGSQKKMTFNFPYIFHN